MNFVKLTLPAMLLAVALSGCTAMQPGSPRSQTPVTALYIKKAQDFENRSELRLAMFTWYIIAELETDNTAAVNAIHRLERKTAKAASLHYQQGRKFYQAGDYPKALKEFLITLRYNPDHRQARYYLKTRLQNRDHTMYQVQPGDSFTRIAAKVFKDPGKAYIIANFNDLDPDKPLLIGQTIILPKIKSEFLQPQSNVDILLKKAQSAHARKQYEEALSLTRQIQDEAPEHPKARRLADAAHFHKGMDYFNQKAYPAAVEQFKQVSPGYEGRDRAIAKARRHIKQLAMKEKLTRAQQHLRNNAWQRVINITEEILAQAPDNAQAKMLFSNASYNLGKLLLNNGKVSQAVELLDRIDTSYEDTGQLLSLARTRMKSQAETHYRSGVKHFINEDLELAIKEWKRALELNPDHPKARKDIENARHLLDKLKAFE
jgi:tetratricopeptide (TPR) repeat protein